MKCGIIFPEQPWMPIDPIILEGARNLWSFPFEDHLFYGGGEDYIGRKRLEEILDECDFLLKVGTPSWWNLHDRMMLAAWLKTDKPFAIWGVGTGGGYNKGALNPWQGIYQEEWLLRQVLNSPKLCSVLTRDATTYRFFRHHSEHPEEVIPAACPGTFAIPLHNTRLREEKNVVVIDVLDPNTIRKDGLGDPATYYQYIGDLVRGIAGVNPDANIRLCCQRAFKAESEPSHKYLDPNTWLDPVGGLGVVDYLSMVLADGFEHLVNDMTDFKEKSTWESFYTEADVYIGSRTHGALPCAGIGIPVCGTPIDMRGQAWEFIAPIERTPVLLPYWEVDRVLNWYSNLNPAHTSRRMIDCVQLEKEKHDEFITRCEIGLGL